MFFGHGTPGNDNPIAPTVKFAIDPQPQHAYDPDKAKFHLKKAGLETLKVDLSAADAAFAGAVDAGAALSRTAPPRRGIDINVIREPDDGYWDNVWLKKPWCVSYWSGRPTCDWMFTTAYAEDAAWNDDVLEAIRGSTSCCKAARSETDRSKRAEMYAEMQQIRHDDGGIIVIMFNNYVERPLQQARAWRHRRQLGHRRDEDRIERWWFA